MKTDLRVPTPADLGGKPGKYKVQLLLSRPGYPIMGEREYKFIDDVVGDSHIAIAKPAGMRKPEDVDRVLLQAFARGEEITLIGLPNDNGYLGKLIVQELFAKDFADAESVGMRRWLRSLAHGHYTWIYPFTSRQFR